MPPRPFPYTLRVGTDICNVSRIRRLVAREGDRHYLEKFTRRILTAPERTYFWQRFGPSHDVDSRLDVVSNFLAGRFAAKEAIRKACNQFQTLERGFQNIVILPVTSSSRLEHQSSRPQGLILDGPYASTTPTGQAFDTGQDVELRHGGGSLPNIADLDGQLCEISISHDGDFATAVALVPLSHK
ncbi:hypothetical protein IQ06DRAFT_302387 [Phaeosphaeriaceae sp. SRC1lsM3a]|nr:hypothetical protein IQ06DRAFT_302387 [Stagonospora sp. SRC1lsM3a]